MKNVTDKQLKWLMSIDDIFFRYIGDRFCDYTRGDNELDLLKHGQWWNKGQMTELVKRVILNGEYNTAERNMLNSLRIHWIGYKKGNR